ncbi:transcription termination/antitermination protein NusG [Methylocystis iwaonis]|uniref:transcription termination/antitermination protein NusG n=1 Tax=Methylocystis iwaonis TaxID=2885079 RepID=UPI002E7BB056|nr:transcription termination/antitermination protein NusG [Methylocystis iwaonis]
MDAEQADLPSLVAKRRAQMTNAPRWYALECCEGKDKEVYARLAALGFEVWRPTVVVRSMRRWRGKRTATGERIKVYAPVFGRYLFVHVEMGDSVRYAVLEQPGVHSWLCWAGSDEPATIADELIEHYRRFNHKPVEVAIVFAVGDTVRALHGPLVGHEGEVTRVDSRGVVCAELTIFGRPTPVIFPVGHVELVEHGRRPPIERDVKQRPRKRA